MYGSRLVEIDNDKIKELIDSNLYIKDCKCSLNIKKPSILT